MGRLAYERPILLLNITLDLACTSLWRRASLLRQTISLNHGDPEYMGDLHLDLAKMVLQTVLGSEEPRQVGLDAQHARTQEELLRECWTCCSMSGPGSQLEERRFAVISVVTKERRDRQTDVTGRRSLFLRM